MSGFLELSETQISESSTVRLQLTGHGPEGPNALVR